MNPYKHLNFRWKTFPSWASCLRPCSGVSAAKMVFCLRQSDLGSYRPNEARIFDLGFPFLQGPRGPWALAKLSAHVSHSFPSRTAAELSVEQDPWACGCTFLLAFYEKSAALVGKCWPGAWCSNSLPLCTRDLDCSHILTFPRQGRSTGLGKNAGRRPGFQCLFYERRSLQARSVLFWIKNKT